MSWPKSVLEDVRRVRRMSPEELNEGSYYYPESTLILRGLATIKDQMMEEDEQDEY
jgi:hypothetical protein